MTLSVRSRAPRALLALALTTGALAVNAQTVSSLMYFNGSTAVGNVTLGTDGALYGLAGNPNGTSVESTFGAGATGGLIYRLTTDASKIETIYQYGKLDVYTGAGPRGALVRDTSGNLYGVTAYNSLEPTFLIRLGAGTIFKVSPDGKTYTKLHQFTDSASTSAPFINADGIAPLATLLLAGDGFLYGSTSQGGTNGTGTLFRVGLDGNNFAVLHHFAPSTSNNDDVRPINVDGSNMARPLTLASNGDLYGVAPTGGANGTGVIFRLHRDGTGFIVLKDFDVSPPLDATGATLQTNVSGSYPAGGLLEVNGALIGTTQLRGANGYGTIYSIGLDGTNFTVLQAFDLTRGAFPTGELILAKDGNIAGTTAAGATLSDGSAGSGTLYEMPVDGSFISTLYVFGQNGATPSGGVIQASDGSFYGTTQQGSPYNFGTVFKYGPATNATPQGNPEPFHNSGAFDATTIGSLCVLVWLMARRRGTRRVDQP